MHYNALTNVFLTLASLNLVNLVFATPVERGVPAQACSHTKKVYVTTTITKGASVAPAPAASASSINGSLPPASNTQYWKSCTTTVTKTKTKKVKASKSSTTVFTLPSPTFPATYSEVATETGTFTRDASAPTIAATAALIGSSLYKNPLDAIKPQPTNRLIYGADNGDGTFVVANVAVQASGGSSLINLEDFLNYVSSVSCATDSITVNFKDASSYGIASSKWSKPFTLITSSSKYCGTDDGSRSYYKVSSSTLDAANKKVTLAVTKTNPDDGAASWSAKWGTFDSVSANSKKREEMDELEEAAHLFSNHVGNRKRSDGSTTINLNSDLFKYIPEITVGPLVIDHDGSGLFGQIILSGGISSDLSSCYASMTLKNIEADLNLQFGVGGATTYNYDRTLAEYSPVGFTIPGLLKLGPYIKLHAGVEFTSESVMNLNNVGFKATLPDSSVKIDFANSPHASASGWGKPNVQPLTPTFSFAGVDVDLSIYIAPAVSLEFEIYDYKSPTSGQYKTVASGEVAFQFPKLTTHMDSTPVCSNGVDKFNNLNFEFDVGMKLIATGDVGPWSGEYVFYDQHWPLGKTCVAF